MKILAIGDFHGKFPKKLKERIKKEKIDLVVSLGDFPPFTLKKEFFKHCYKKEGVELWEVIGENRYKEATIKDNKEGEKVLKKLNNLPVLVLTTLGNYDHPCDDVSDKKKSRSHKIFKKLGLRENHFQFEIKRYKNIKEISYQAIKFNDFVFIGMRGHSFPGLVKSKAYKKHRRILDNLFKKYKKEKIIFVSHIVPYNTKLDKITGKDADKKVKGKHYGSKLTRRIIDRWQPILTLAGHMHESSGKDKLGKTLVVNPGAVLDGKFAIIDIPLNKKGKIKVEFVK